LQHDQQAAVPMGSSIFLLTGTTSICYDMFRIEFRRVSTVGYYSLVADIWIHFVGLAQNPVRLFLGVGIRRDGFSPFAHRRGRLVSY
jgi:hypothetical protein